METWTRLVFNSTGGDRDHPEQRDLQKHWVRLCKTWNDSPSVVFCSQITIKVRNTPWTLTMGWIRPNTHRKTEGSLLRLELVFVKPRECVRKSCLYWYAFHRNNNYFSPLNVVKITLQAHMRLVDVPVEKAVFVFQRTLKSNFPFSATFSALFK